MLNGFMGKLLWVDLSTGRMEDEILEENFCRRLLGGYGFGANLLFNRLKPGIDPLGPENILGILTGVFTGTGIPGGSRYTAVGKSPLTGGWGDANSGGFFGPHLRYSGYDGVLFTGQSSKPVYLLINDGKAELRDASHLWGKDTFDTEDILRATLGQDIQVACIGPAGEKLALIAAIMNDKGRAAGRSGLGAVMGSKKLKAIAVKGNRKVPIFDPAKLSELRKKALSQPTGMVGIMRNFGTCAMTVHAIESDDTPVKNWGGTGLIDFPTAERIGGNAVIELQEKKYACYQCPLGCGGHMKPGTGEYRYGADAHKPEYETLGMFGSNCLNDNLDSIIKVNDICNRLGLDTISAGASIAFAIECYENGIITQKDTGGIEMTWGNHKAIVAMTEKMGERQGFGDVLADGTKKAAERIGHGAEKYAMQTQGQEYPAHSPKYLYKWGIVYRMDATPARHTQGGGIAPPGLPLPPVDPETKAGRGAAQKIATDFNHVVNSSGLCQIVFGTYPDINTVAEFMKAVTGWDVTLDELLVVGERIANLRQAFNIREGLNSLNYNIPDRIAGKPPKTIGPMAGVSLQEETMDREYLTAMDWDLKTCKPSRKKLLELGLDNVAKELWK